MNKLEEFNNVIKQHINNALLKEICIDLMELNDIKYHFVNRRIFNKYRYITDSASIEYGSIVIMEDNPSWNMVLHELCHVLVVEKEYRHLVDIDTVKSYKKINLKYPERKKYRTESATFGLQDLILKKLNMDVLMSGTFFHGKVGINSNLNEIWKDLGEDVIQTINIDFSKYVKKNINVNECNIMPSNNSIVMVLTNSGSIFKCRNVQGNFSVINGKLNLNKSNISKWSYI